MAIVFHQAIEDLQDISLIQKKGAQNIIARLIQAERRSAFKIETKESITELKSGNVTKTISLQEIRTALHAEVARNGSACGRNHQYRIA